MSNVMLLGQDEETRTIIQELLESDGFSVSTDSSIIELDESKDAEQIDLYIVDIADAGRGGLELIRRLRTRSECGIIILSAQDTEASRIAGLDVGADDYVGKPFRPLELAARVKAVYRRTTGKPAAGRERPEAIEVGGYRLVPDTRSVLDGEGREIVLTTAEYNIFSVLACNQGVVLSRDEIISLSKGRDWRCYERSVDGLISRLRRKLPAENGASHFIKTIHGTGYTVTAS